MQKTSKKMLLFGNLKLGRGGGDISPKGPQKITGSSGRVELCL